MKTLLIAFAVWTLAVPAFAIDIQADLQASAEAQRAAAHDARVLGLWGTGLELGGLALWTVGVAIAPNPAYWAGDLKYMTPDNPRDWAIVAAIGGGALMIGGGVTSFVGWLRQLDANDAQAEVNRQLLQGTTQKAD